MDRSMIDLAFYTFKVNAPQWIPLDRLLASKGII